MTNDRDWVKCPCGTSIQTTGVKFGRAVEQAFREQHKGHKAPEGSRDMSKKSKGEMPDQESKRRKDEQRELFDRAARTRAREAREADEQRIWQQNQQHNTL